MMKQTNQDRVLIVNELITEIAKVARGLFRNEKKEHAHFYLKGYKLYFVSKDGTQGEIKRKTPWQDIGWAGHGSTLSSQIITFAQFIFTGEKSYLDSRYWGYSFDDLIKIHTKARELGFCWNSDFVVHEYHKDISKDGNRYYFRGEEMTPVRG